MDITEHSEELFDKYSYYVDDNLSSMEYISGSNIIIENSFKLACLEIAKPLQLIIGSLQSEVSELTYRNKYLEYALKEINSLYPEMGHRIWHAKSIAEQALINNIR